MGCDINSFAERRSDDRWQEVRTEREPFGGRNYNLFGFLAGVRDYSTVRPIVAPRGTPSDASANVREQLEDCHCCSWLSVAELSTFDYDQRVPGEGEMTTFRDILGPQFFDDLAMLQEAGAERVVFGFDT